VKRINNRKIDRHKFKPLRGEKNREKGQHFRGTQTIRNCEKNNTNIKKEKNIKYTVTEKLFKLFL
jgi:hypothetical protein